MSSTLVSSVAPSRISWWHPALVGWSMRPGTAKINRPCTPAKRAVIIAPPDTSLSTTMIASQMPATTRLRIGKVCLSA